MEQQVTIPNDISVTLWQALCKALQEALVPELMHSAKKASPAVEGRICNMLLDLGIPPKLKGYSFLREAIRLYAEDPCQTITKELYCAVATKCNATATQVERGIRTAVNIGWERGDSHNWRKYFSASSCRPSNGTFISRLAAGITSEEISGQF